MVKCAHQVLLAGVAVLHGEAIAVGMCLAFEFSEILGLSPAADCARVRSHIAAVGLPTRLTDVGLDNRGRDLCALMGQDKKATVRGPALILVRGIGQAFLQRDVDPGLLADYLAGAA